MIVPLRDADVDSCGRKAGALGALLRAGLPVPDGFVIPFDAYRAIVRTSEIRTSTTDDPDAARPSIDIHSFNAALLDALMRGLESLGRAPVAVRSSAANEDTAAASAAGQYETFLGVQGLPGVIDAIRACWASLHSRRAIEYRTAVSRDQASEEPAMAVLVQRHVDADVSGVMFTPTDPETATEIEASWGLGVSVVGGTVTPDSYRIEPDGSITRSVADKRTRRDRQGTRLVTRPVPNSARCQPSIEDATAARLAHCGRTVAAVLGGAQDIEWAIADGRIWLLQARPVTAAPPRPPSGAATTSAAESATTSAAELAPVLVGTPGSQGTATGPARIVHGPSDFSNVRPGDILVCPYTDPAWTPLLRIVAGVVTETGGVLSHAAIVARERHIPAVLGVVNATTRLQDGDIITIDGTTGRITAAGA